MRGLPNGITPAAGILDLQLEAQHSQLQILLPAPQDDYFDQDSVRQDDYQDGEKDGDQHIDVEVSLWRSPLYRWVCIDFGAGVIVITFDSGLIPE